MGLFVLWYTDRRKGGDGPGAGVYKMIYRNYEDVHTQAAQMPKKTIAVGGAHDEVILEMVAMAAAKDIADFILVGREDEIRRLAAEQGVTGGFTVINEEDDKEACLIASDLVRDGEADVLMKGMVNSSTFLHAVLDKERGLRAGKLLSHLAIYEVPSYPKLMFMCDGGMNTAPDLEAKKKILSNAVEALHRIGIEEPKVAVVCANEMVDEKIPATVDAAAIAEAAAAGAFGTCIVEGPTAMDLAVSKEAVAHKGLTSRIAGETDLFLFPTIECCNTVGKTLMYFAGGKMTGLVLGAAAPVVMTSRTETAEGKLNSVLLACLIAHGVE